MACGQRRSVDARIESEGRTAYEVNRELVETEERLCGVKIIYTYKMSATVAGTVYTSYICLTLIRMDWQLRKLSVI